MLEDLQSNAIQRIESDFQRDLLELTSQFSVRQLNVIEGVVKCLHSSAKVDIEYLLQNKSEVVESSSMTAAVSSIDLNLLEIDNALVLYPLSVQEVSMCCKRVVSLASEYLDRETWRMREELERSVEDLAEQCEQVGQERWTSAMTDTTLIENDLHITPRKDGPISNEISCRSSETEMLIAYVSDQVSILPCDIHTSNCSA
jgi:hypothetical protein